MNQNQFEQKFNEKVQVGIKDLIFPAENIPDGLRDYLTVSLPVFTYHSVKCTLAEFEQVAIWAAEGGELPMVTAFIILQVTRGVTAKDTGLNLMTYIEMNKLLDEMALAWDVITKPIKDQANIEINAEYREAMEAEECKRGIKPAKRRVILPN